MKNKLKISAVLTAIVLLTGCAGSAKASTVIYPKSIDFEDTDARRAVWKTFPRNEAFDARINDFSYDFTAAAFETVSEDERYQSNHVISPMSLYYGLSMAYAGAEGKTKEELSELLYMDGIDDETFFYENRGLYNRLYEDNEITGLKIANSIWVQREMAIKEDYTDLVGKNLYASVHPVDFGEQETSELIGEWLSSQTGDIMDEMIQVEPVQDQVMAMYNTIYFKDQWADEFHEEKTEEGIFHCWNGVEVQVDFMNKEMQATHVHGEDYHMVGLRTKGRSTMVLVQPDEGVDLYDWLSQPANVEALNAYYHENTTSSYGMVTLSLPKFDFGCCIDVKKVLEHQCVTVLFDQSADFTGIADEEILYLDGIQQKTKIAIDEKGIEAATYTELLYCGAAMPEEDLVMTLDRPFIIGVVNDGQLMFAGIVNDPTLN